MNISKITDKNFRKYATVLTGYDCSNWFKTMEAVSLPEGVAYEPSIEKLEEDKVAEQFKNQFFGETDIEVGYCVGHNQKLNALEYHRSSEINVALTDMILMLGKREDITDEYTYDTENVEAFFIPKGTIVELYATTLHFAPCGVSGQGFKAIVILPRGTNYPSLKAVDQNNDDKLRTHINKWLIAHKDGNVDGAYIGLVGKNLEV